MNKTRLKMLLVVLAAATLSACSFVMPEDYEIAGKTCEPHGGIMRVEPSVFYGKVYVQCKNGTEFNIKYKYRRN